MNKQKFVDYTARPVLSVALLAALSVPFAAGSGTTYASDPVQAAQAPSTLSIQAPASDAVLAASVDKAAGSSGTLSEKQIKEIAAKLAVDEDAVRAAAARVGASVQGPGFSVVTASSKTKLISGFNGELPSGAIVAPAQPVIVLDGGQYGWRYAPDAVGGGKLEFHNGTDVAAASGTPVVSALPEGTVTAVFFDVWGGNRVEVTHANGTKTTYSHLLEVNVHEGDKLALGEQLGSVGATGIRVTGPHLHFEVWVNGKTVDPQSFDWVTDAKTIPAANDGYKLSAATPPSDLNGIPTAPSGEEIQKAAQKAAAEKKTAADRATAAKKAADEKSAAAKKAAAEKDAASKKTAAEKKSADEKAKAPAKKVADEQDAAEVKDAAEKAKAPAKKVADEQDAAEAKGTDEKAKAPTETEKVETAKPTAPVAPAPAPTETVAPEKAVTPAPAPTETAVAAPVEAAPAPEKTVTPVPAPTETAAPVVAPAPAPSPSPAAPQSEAPVLTEQQLHASRTADTDEDGVVDYLDTDLDGDGILNHVDTDLDGDGVLNSAESASEMWIVLLP